MPHNDDWPQRRSVSWPGVLLALAFLTIASVGFSGSPFWLFNEAIKWIFAAALALVGLGLLATTVPGLRRKR